MPSKTSSTTGAETGGTADGPETGEQGGGVHPEAPEAPTVPQAAAPQPLSTGREPTALGVHQPGRAPGDYVDHGPVTLSVDTHRSTQ